MTQQFNLSQPLFGGVEINEYRPKLQQNYDKNGNIYYTDENGEVVAPHKLPYMERLGRRIKAKLTPIYKTINQKTHDAWDMTKLIGGLATRSPQGFAAVEGLGSLVDDWIDGGNPDLKKATETAALMYAGGKGIEGGIKGLKWLADTPFGKNVRQKTGEFVTEKALPAIKEGYNTVKNLPIVQNAINMATPYIGKRIAENTVMGSGAGILGGGTEGIIRSLITGGNPLETMLQDVVIGGVGGGTGGYAIGKFGQGLARRGLQDAANREQYFNDYISGLKGDPALRNDVMDFTVGQKTPFDKATADFKMRINGGNTFSQPNFIGENAFNAPKGKLMEAKQMAMHGDNPVNIWENTGWFKGVDDKWRYEIPYGELYEHPEFTEWSDIYGRSLKSYSIKLKDLYNNPELYKNYPDFAEKTVYFDKMPKTTRGSTNYEDIFINQDLLPIENPQYVEELNRIKNTEEYKNFDKLRTQFNNNQISYEEFAPLEDVFNNSVIGDRYNDLLWDDVPGLPQYLQKGDAEKLRGTLIHEIQHNIQNKEGFAVGGGPISGDDYMKLAGEVEARLASNRSLLRKPGELNDVAPFSESLFGYDIKPQEQIVKFDHNNSNLYDKLVNNDNLTPEQLAAKLKAKAKELRTQKTTYAKGENMNASTMNLLMRNGSDIPPIDFAPRDVIINNRTRKEIWIDNQKEISSAFVQHLANKSQKSGYLKKPMADGFTYYAKFIDGTPVFYKKVRTK